MTAISTSAVSSTVIHVNVTGLPAGTASTEIQYSRDPEFQFDVAPIVNVASTSFDLGQFNQAERYFLRGRSVSGGGARGPWSSADAVWTPKSSDRVTAPAAVMIEPALFVPPEPVLDWMCSTAIAGYSARALGVDNPMAALFCNTQSGVAIVEMRTAGGPVDTIAVLGSNAPESATITIKAGATLQNIASGSPTFSHGPVPFRASANLPGRRGYHSLVRLPSAQTHRYWRVEIAAAVPGGVFVATHLVLGKGWSTKNFVVDSKSETLLDGGSITRDRSGNPTRMRGWRGRAVEFELAQMTEAQYEESIEHLRWTVGITEPVLIVPNSKPGAFLHDRMLYGQMAATRALNTTSPRFSHAFAVSSII